MDTVFRPLKIVAEFQLADRASRTALETKIDTFISGQDPGSYAVTQYREDLSDATNPFWFRMHLNIVVSAIGDVATIRTAILGNIDTFGTVTKFKFDFEEVKS